MPLQDKRIKYSRLFFVLCGLCIIPFLYGAATGALLYSIAVLCFGFLLGFIGVSNSYRAWQLYSDSVFSDDPKGQFHWWLRNRNWFISPLNPEYEINLLPGDEDHYYDEDQVVDLDDGSEYNYPDDYYIPDFSLLTFHYFDPRYIDPDHYE